MRLQAYRQITNTLPNRGWGDFDYYKSPFNKDESYGVFIKSRDGILKLGFPLYINFSKRKNLKIDRIILTLSIFISTLLIGGIVLSLLLGMFR